MADEAVERLADVLVGYSTEVRPGDLVVIDASELAAPLVRAVYARVLDAGGHPEVNLTIDGLVELLLAEGSDEQLSWISPGRRESFERADIWIRLDADTNTRTLSGTDPGRQAIAARAREALRDRYLERAAAGELRWLVTLFPTNALAQEAAMSLAEYERFVFAAGWLDHDDPVAAWRAFGEELEGLAARLGEHRELRVVADETDLVVGVEGRRWIASRGNENFPDGEVFTGPVETSLAGQIAFTYPATFGGRIVDGIRLRFEDGEVVEANASRGEEFLREMLGMDEGARRAGEFAFGMNEAIRDFSSHILFDEKIGGTVHLALGRSYPATGGVNRSALHWDLVCDLRDGGEVYADGELVYRDGRFLDGFA